MSDHTKIWPEGKSCGVMVSVNLDAEFYGRIFYPDVDVDDGGAGLGAGHSVGGDLLGCDGHIGRLGFHGARPAECRGDNEFFAFHQ